MKPGADLNQRREPAAHLYRTARRLHDAAQVLEHRALSGAVVPDYPQRLALLQIEGDVVEDPEFFRCQRSLPIATHRALDERRDKVAQRVVSLAATKPFVDVIQSE